MRTSRIKRLIWSGVSLVGAGLLIAATCTNSNAGVRRTAPMAASTIQQQKPIKLRYYGGPKSPMYPE